MIVAFCHNRGIGYRGALPWKLTSDMQYFKRVTMGNNNNAVIMGKNTWMGLSKRPLPHRDNLILSTSHFRTPQSEVLTFGEKLFNKEVHVFSSITDVEQFCLEKDYDEVWVIGGEQTYKQFIQHPNLQDIYVTMIDNDYSCDTFFPEIPTSFSVNTKTKWHLAGEKGIGGVPYRFMVYSK